MKTRQLPFLTQKHLHTNTRRALWLLFSLVCGLFLRPTSSFASYGETPIKTIVIQAAFGVSQNEVSGTSHEMGAFLLSSPVVNRENIAKIAANYLSSRLGDRVPVLLWGNRGYGDPGNLPRDESTMLLRLDYTVWPQEIDGKTILIGAMAVHKLHLAKEGFRTAERGSEFQPVDSFVVTDDPAQTKHNLEATVARLLFRYGTISKGSDE